MKRIHVVIATGTMNAGGAEALIMEMLRHKSDFIKYIMLIHYAGVIEPGIYDKEIKKLGVPIVYIPSVGSIGEKAYTQVFLERIKYIGKADILHSHLNAVGGIIAKAAKLAGIEHRIIHCHANITYTGSKTKILFDELKLSIMKLYVNRYGTAYWACSNSAGKRLFYQNKKVMIIPNVIDVNKYLSSDSRREKEKRKLGIKSSIIIGSVGRITPIKNYELAIKVLGILKHKGISADFVCYGRVVDEKYFRQLIELAKEIGVLSHIHFMGNSTEVNIVISAFDVFIMPSISEGFGMAAIEAQAAGIPTIVSTGVPALVDMGLGLTSFLGFKEEEWANEILAIQDIKHPKNRTIIDKFNKARHNSPIMVKEIEYEYQIMNRIR